MKYVLGIFLLTQLATNLTAQIRSNTWLLSNNNVISVKNDVSVLSYHPDLPLQLEGTARVSNCNNENIFTATTLKIYDCDWNIINNGDNIDGDRFGSSIQSPVVLQRPGFPRQYYVFYAKDRISEDPATLRYSIVNLCDQNSAMHIKVDEKNIQIAGQFSERLQLVEIDRDNYWLITTSLQKRIFKAYKIDENGINSAAVITEFDDTFGSDGWLGTLKLNNQKDKLAWSSSNGNGSRLSIFDFDLKTGIISNEEVIISGNSSVANNLYGVEWSPSDDYLYYTTNFGLPGIYCYSFKDGSISTLFSTNAGPIGDLKLTPSNDKIVVVQSFNRSLAQITDIENGGLYSQLNLALHNGLPFSWGLQEQVINYGLEIPTDIVETWDLTLNGDQNATTLSLPSEYTDVVWSDGQTGNSATFIEPGVYGVSANNNCQPVCQEFTIKRITNLQPDINATFVNLTVDGDLSTNDVAQTGTTYESNAIVTSYPIDANFTLTINSDGSYIFVSDKVGTYIWDIPICSPTSTVDCPYSELVITVVDNIATNLRPIANTDIASTTVNTDVEIYTLENDRCALTGGCLLDPGSVAVISAPMNGTVVKDAGNGNIIYSPNLGFSGQDTLSYEVCVDEEPNNCSQAYQIITVVLSTDQNSTLAADDFNIGGQDMPITGNVSNNDTDPDLDNQIVQPQTIITAEGGFSLLSDGTYTFFPGKTFFGPIEFPYTVCDDNSVQECANATLHLLVLRDLHVQLRVYLEGALINNDNLTGTTHNRPLMRDDLRESPFTGERYIPNDEPYETLPIAEHWETKENPQVYKPFYRFDYDYSQVANKFKAISNANVFFAVTGEDAAVDWVSVELRNKDNYHEIVASRSGIVQRDGDVMDLNGKVDLRFPGVMIDDYYVVVRHRNHMGAMTSTAKSPFELSSLIDFTVEETGFFDFGTNKNSFDYTGMAQVNLYGTTASNKIGYKALWAGDFDGNGSIKYTSPDDDLNNLFDNIFGYESNGEINFLSNFDYAFGYQSGDFDLNSKSKFDSPNDDKNYLFGQAFFNPLNSSFYSNFDFFIEQVPEAFTPK